MWLAQALTQAQAKTAEPSPVWSAVASVAGALGALGAAVWASWFSLRGTRTSAAVSREAAFDARVDKELERLQVALSAAEAAEEAAHGQTALVRDQLAAAREAYAALRWAVRMEGYDPDELVRRHAQG